MIDRRHFLLTSLALLAAPLAGEAQQSGKVYRIGLIVTSSLASDAAGAEPRSRPVAGLMRGLRDHGYTYGRDFVTEPRSTESMVERIPTIAAELTELKVDVVVAGGPALTGLKQARFAIPVVMSGSPDPVRAGLVASLSRPGGTFTGMSLQHAELDRKRLELLTQIVRGASRIAVLRGPDSEGNWQETQAAARLLNREVLSLEIRSAGEIEGAFRSATKWHAGTLIVIAGALLDRAARQVVEQAAKHRLPAMYTFPNWYMDEGGLISYGVDLVDIWRRAAYYVDKILKGAKPGDLPVEQPTKFELVINLKTAKALGLTIPPSLLARADQVIE
jgi:putative ABC transport system substrate-binding protein